MKKYWAVQYKDEYISVRIYHGLLSRKSIESAHKNKLVKWIIHPFLADSREEAEKIVRIKLKLGIIKKGD